MRLILQKVPDHNYVMKLFIVDIRFAKLNVVFMVSDQAVHKSAFEIRLLELDFANQ
jgi:hypothetical protein